MSVPRARARRAGALAGALLASAGVSAGASAGAADAFRSPVDQLVLESSPVDALNPSRRPMHYQLQLQVGQFLPSGEALKKVYGERVGYYAMMAGYHLFPDMVLSVRAGLARGDGTAVGRTSGLPLEGETTQISMVPIEAGGTWYLRLSTPLITPFVSASLLCQLYREEVGAARVSGGKWGAHGRIGVEVQLDGGPAPAWTLEARKGLRGTALVLEGGYRWADSFGRSGLDLSGVMVMAGVAFRF